MFKHGFLSKRRPVLLAGFALGIAVAGVLFATTRSVEGQENGEIRATLRGAIETNYSLPVLQPGQAGHMSSQALWELRAKIQTAYAKFFAEDALTGRVSAMLDWADHVSANPGVSHEIEARVESFEIGEPVVQGDFATVSGSFLLYDRTAATRADGSEETWGGRGRHVFTAASAKRGGRWLITSLADRQQDYIEDPSAGPQAAASGSAPSSTPAGSR